MANLTSYKYVALGSSDYITLASYLIETKGAIVTLNPTANIIVVAPTPECPDVINEIGKYIDEEALSFQTSPIEIDSDNESLLIEDYSTDGNTLRQILSGTIAYYEDIKKSYDIRCETAENALAQARKDKDMYSRWYSEASSSSNRIKEQVKAISVLLSSIKFD